MTRLSAPRYDLFKLLVTIILIILLILLLMRGSATAPAAALPTENAPLSTPTQRVTSIAASETIAAEPTASVTPPGGSTATPAAPASTLTSTSTSQPAATATQASINVTSTSAPAADESSSCNTRLPSRLGVGQRARVAQRLNLRTAPSIDAPILQTNAVDTTVEIFGGPVCTPVGTRAYLWWQVRLVDGAEGWSAETQLNEPAYLLQPIQ
ncbi:MAG: SH3 domain-containing protein [Chloroflexota bacterium]|nr:SH3 domain-containing protein [Chloroflexota bacterium]